MAFHHSPRIITDGLVLSLDAADKNSYIGSGTAWTDLSGNGNNGTLTNGPTFDSGHGGSIVFAGDNDVVNFGVASNLFDLDMSEFSIELWFRGNGTTPTTGTSPRHLGFTYGIRLIPTTTGYSFGVDDTGASTINYISYSDGPNLRDDNSWHQIVCSNNGTTSYIYQDGVLRASGVAAWTGETRWPTNPIYLGRDNNNNNYFFTGKIAIFKVYTKTLSSAEISQNFNAQRSRFGV